ncbi:MAG: RNA polymerase sigma factor [Candidatus Acidiferrales bacterium]
MAKAGSPAGITTAPLEPQILRARAEGRVSPDESFEQLYAAYAPLVLAWFRMRVDATAADDLFQDVWAIFYNRWRGWVIQPEMLQGEAKPVLSFLFRTAHFVLIGHRRLGANRSHSSAEEVEIPDGQRSPERMQQQLELGRCLEMARKLCPPEELDVLMAKLAGVSAREIARTLQVSEPVVDHRFRSAIARLKQEMQPRTSKAAKRKGGARGDG